MLPPLMRQFLVAGSTHLAAFSAGGVVGYPGVLLHQLKANDSIIQLDLDNGSWIGSVHGIAGLPSIFLPFLMQYRGRKIVFILSCIFIILGWTLTYTAQSVMSLIIAECFHGLGTNSLLAVSFLSVSEMVRPKYRNLCLVLYSTYQIFGISLVSILGGYLHWKTVGFVMGSPVLFALVLGLMWPESPSWLAYKGRLRECEAVFKMLRGTDEESRMELMALLNSPKVKKETSRKNCKDLKAMRRRGWLKKQRQNDFNVHREDFFEAAQNGQT
ncbi:unnamed protein product [Chrysodeixis includens]|uniref:Major facilitator superfamily (MFS) profile domain-containing protein n=1 Tax=Chrysodeixis includens TaxID=689277 RepID=A0A9P0BWR3_CHRIL|nr:unnamed protein product [Chrysodeixis includens]